MKMITKSVLVAGIATLAVTTMLAKGSGTPVHTVRFTFKVAFTNTGAGPGSGSATGSESIQSNGKDTENLNVTLKGLAQSSPYSLFATTAGTNGSSFDAADFTSDKKGDAKVTLSTKPGKTGFPIGGLDPLTAVTELDIVSGGSNAPVTILTADTTKPSTFTFSDRQTTTGGSLSVSASNKGAKLSLTATGLTSGDVFALSLNGTPTTNNTFTATSKGALKINTPITVNVLDLNEVDLTDTTQGTTVLTFPMP